MQSDWKRFRALVPVWRERYLEKLNQRISTLLLDANKTPTERFWEAKSIMDKEQKMLRACFDGHSSSKMPFYLGILLVNEVIDRKDLAEFSESLQENLLRQTGQSSQCTVEVSGSPSL